MTTNEIAAWIEYVGEPLRKDVEALKRAFWIAFGGGAGAGAILTLLSSYLLKKLGLG